MNITASKFRQRELEAAEMMRKVAAIVLEVRAEAPPPPPPTPFKARLIGVHVVRGQGARTVVVRLAVNTRARGLVELRRRGRVLARAAYNLERGTRTLRLRLPKKVTRGWSIFRLRVQPRAPGSRARTFTRRLWLPPARG